MTKVKNKEDGVRLMGFGHRVYKNYDPRAAIIKKTAHTILEKTAGGDQLLEIAMGLEEIALADDYFIERKLYPNVDFYTGLIYKSMGFPTRMFTVLFALGRLPGWIAQWREMIEDPHDQDRPPAPGLHRRGRARLRAGRRPLTAVDSRGLAARVSSRRVLYSRPLVASAPTWGWAPAAWSRVPGVGGGVGPAGAGVGAGGGAGSGGVGVERGLVGAAGRPWPGPAGLFAAAAASSSPLACWSRFACSASSAAWARWAASMSGCGTGVMSSAGTPAVRARAKCPKNAAASRSWPGQSRLPSSGPVSHWVMSTGPRGERAGAGPPGGRRRRPGRPRATAAGRPASARRSGASSRGWSTPRPVLPARRSSSRQPMRTCVLASVSVPHRVRAATSSMSSHHPRASRPAASAPASACAASAAPAARSRQERSPRQDPARSAAARLGGRGRAGHHVRVDHAAHRPGPRHLLASGTG